MHQLLLLAWFAVFAGPADLPVVRVGSDDLRIVESCRVEIGASPIVDVQGDGVIQIDGSDIEVDLTGAHLRGAAEGVLPDGYAGTGIRITGTNVTLRGGHISGFKCGVHAMSANGLTIEFLDVSDNFRQRLKSTAAREDASDWLWPHANDGNEWLTNYGAGVYIEDSGSVTVRDLRARDVQNGIVLDRVNDSKVYDNDCSFLSGWGLAMWRSSENVVSRNAFDFCVRGYSHGVYNRGQDSAGILMFEQCWGNTIAENSATHGGDGLFGFAGKEALGEFNPQEDLRWYKNRGNTSNSFIGNDFSYAAAHGLELTFSCRNTIARNRFVGNAICGIWGGYSQCTIIALNHFERNGGEGYGLERGGINIEHGLDNTIHGNSFRENRCGIHLWWDDDAAMFMLPWYRANKFEDYPAATIVKNNFIEDEVALHLRNLRTAVEVGGNQFQQVGQDVHLEGPIRLMEPEDPNPMPVEAATKDVPGTKTPFGARIKLAGRENIIMTEWGPWDHESPLMLFVQRFDQADEYRLLGAKAVPNADQVTTDEGDVFVDVLEDRVIIRPKAVDTLVPYRGRVMVEGKALQFAGALTGGTWVVKTFASTVDPREDGARWRKEGLESEQVHTLTADALDFSFGSGGMSEARGLPVKLPQDRFGTISTRKLTIPAGSWRIRTLSDDGIRVWMNEKLVIDDWTWHGPTEQVHEFTLVEAREMEFRVEHFELDGYAVLKVEFDRVALEARLLIVGVDTMPAMTIHGSIGCALMICVATCALPACQTQSNDPNYYLDGQPRQKYAYDEVKRRVKELQVGLPRYDVLIELGSPAENRGDVWVYVPAQPTLLLPSEVLEVHFRSGYYSGHEFKGVILGERLN